jgi:medium-chain acyl-[acyl-carrier-protein] hydrolase
MRADAGASARTVTRGAIVRRFDESPHAPPAAAVAADLSAVDTGRAALVSLSADPFLGSLAHDEPHVRLRLFCVPHAGGGTASFRRWARSFPPGVELVPVQLPGRESRVAELPFVRLAPLISALTEAVAPYLDTPFALFGHSMGALVCFELARYLRRAFGVLPSHLFVSGAPAPQLGTRHRTMHTLSTPALLAEVRQLGGTPDEVLGSDELMRMLVPVLRADLAIVETYRYFADAPLSCPLSVFGGLGDTRVARDELAAWRVQTSGQFALHMVPGEHFFAYDENGPVPHVVARALARATGSASGASSGARRDEAREEALHG